MLSRNRPPPPRPPLLIVTWLNGEHFRNANPVHTNVRYDTNESRYPCHRKVDQRPVFKGDQLPRLPDCDTCQSIKDNRVSVLSWHNSDQDLEKSIDCMFGGLEIAKDHHCHLPNPTSNVGDRGTPVPEIEGYLVPLTNSDDDIAPSTILKYLCANRLS